MYQLLLSANNLSRSFPNISLDTPLYLSAMKRLTRSGFTVIHPIKKIIYWKGISAETVHVIQNKLYNSTENNTIKKPPTRF